MTSSISTVKNPHHILRANQFDRSFLDHLYHLTDTIRRFEKTDHGLRYLTSLLSHKRVMLYFTQPSTRTFLSFMSACHILGAKTCEIRDPSTSSEAKGETVQDSLRTFSSYVDLIIMRSPIPGLCDQMAKLLDESCRPIPIINAGSGPDQHPTQALLDLYTLRRGLKQNGNLENKTICFVGDLKRGRTIRSLAQLLTHFNKIKMIFCSPKEYAIEEDLRNILLNSDRIKFSETQNFEESIKSADAIYMTRIQDEYDKVKGDSQKTSFKKYHLKAKHLSIIKKDALILHPMPRREEIDPLIDFDPRAKYWRQERNGMWTRVALISLLLGVDQNILLPSL